MSDMGLEDLSEEELQQLMELGVIPSKQDILARQISQAQAMQNTPSPEMRGTGRMQTAASPLEFINSALRTGLGTRDLKALEKKQQDQLDAQVAARKLFLAKMGRKVDETPPEYQRVGDYDD